MSVLILIVERDRLRREKNQLKDRIKRLKKAGDKLLALCADAHEHNSVDEVNAAIAEWNDAKSEKRDKL